MAANVGYKVEKILIFWAESPVYVGSERGVGTIDLRLQRNVTTNVPEIYSTSLKGALRNHLSLIAEDDSLKNEINWIFGDENRIGAVSFLNLKILLLPVHSNFYSYVFVTSPSQLADFSRLLHMKGEELGFDLSGLYGLSDGEATVDKSFPAGDGEYLYLANASFRFKIKKMDLSNLIKKLSEVVKVDVPGYDYLLTKIKKALVIVSDESFMRISNRALFRVARIRIVPETKTAETGALFFQELLPEYSIFFTAVLVSQRAKKHGDPVKRLMDLFDKKLINLGGDESVGRGFLRIKFY